MLYQAPAFRPNVLPTVLGQPTLGQPILGQTFDELIGLPGSCGDILRLVYHAGGTWLGIRTGLKEKGVTSTIGWILGVGMGVAGILDVVSLGKRIAGTHPKPVPPQPAPPQ